MLDDCSRLGDAHIAPQAKKTCEIRANYDENLLKLSVRQPVRGVRAGGLGQHLLEQVLEHANGSGEQC